MPFLRLPRMLVAAVAAGVICLAPAARAQEGSVGLADLVAAWLASPHGDHHAPSFTYWNKDGAVPVACAACHSGPGFIDFLGADGTAAGVVDHPAPINSPVGCASCHTAAAHALDTVTFPSGARVEGLGASAVCAVCHQGRQSGSAVARITEGQDEDTVAAQLAFVNIHYGVAAAVMHGAETGGGYHYPGRSYAGRFGHVPTASDCVACHDPHALTVDTTGCLSCHRGVEDLRAIRTRHRDFDGDGRADGGIHAEIAGLHAQLGEAIQRYGAEVSGAAIGYAKRHPYFFHDTDGDGVISEAEAVAANRYAAWTPRLLRAAYNYQVVAKDPGAYVHNPAYAIQLLYDSLHALGERVAIDLSGLHRP